jgi:hypothetical protein
MRIVFVNSKTQTAAEFSVGIESADDKSFVTINGSVDMLRTNGLRKNKIHVLGNWILAKQSIVDGGLVEMFSRPKIERILFHASKVGG